MKDRKVHFGGFVYVPCGREEYAVESTYEKDKVTCKACKNTNWFKNWNYQKSKNV